MYFMLYNIELVDLSILKLLYINHLPQTFLLLRITTKLYLQNCNISRNYGKLHFYVDIKTYIHDKQFILAIVYSESKFIVARPTIRVWYLINEFGCLQVLVLHIGTWLCYS